MEPKYSFKKILFELFCENDSISRAHISRITGLSKQTVSIAIASLESRNLVVPVGSTKGHIGRRAITYRLSPSAYFGVGIDLGGTSLRSGLIDFAGEVRSEHAQLTPRSSLSDLVKSISQSIDILNAKANVKSQINQIVIGVPGVVNPKTEIISMSPNVEYLNGVNLKQILSKQFNCDVIIENDVNLAAIGEQDVSQLQDFIFIALGTGIGMAIVADGKLRHGAHGAAGEIGYMSFDSNALDQSNTSNLEKILGGKYIENRHELQSGQNVTMNDIFKLAIEGDEFSQKTINKFINDLSVALKNVISVLDPAVIVLGGGIGSRPEISKTLHDHLNIELTNKVDVVGTRLGSKAGTIGAMTLALKAIRKKVISDYENLEMDEPS